MKSGSIQKAQLIIPMSGNGSRFVAAGYSTLKPLIMVHHLRMVEWVIKAFLGQANHKATQNPIKRIVFICRQNHLQQYSNMREILLKSVDKVSEISKDIEIEIVELTQNVEKDYPSQKGPVAALSLAKEFILNEIPTIVSYCDYYMRWDIDKFWELASNTQCDGALPCYTGFHPHLIPNHNVYASCKIDSQNNLIEIREKYSFSQNKEEALHSPGTYYFRRGDLLKHYVAEALLRDDMATGGEHFVSLLYNLMVQDSKSVKIWPIVDKFCQWGTPEDLSEYLFWTNSLLTQKIEINM